MALYSVCLFLRDTDAGVQKERLQNFIINAANKDEALGMCIRNPDREYQRFPVAYHLVTEVTQ